MGINPGNFSDRTKREPASPADIEFDDLLPNKREVATC